MKVTHAPTYTADDGTEYTDARLCAAHEQVLAKGEHAYGTMGFETARDALVATLPAPPVLDRGSLMRALASPGESFDGHAPDCKLSAALAAKECEMADQWGNL